MGILPMQRCKPSSPRLSLLHGRLSIHLGTMGGAEELIEDLLALKNAVQVKETCPLEEEDFA